MMDATAASRIAAAVCKGKLLRQKPAFDSVAEVARRVVMDPRATLDHIVVAYLFAVPQASPNVVDALTTLEPDLSASQYTALVACTPMVEEPDDAYIERLTQNSIATLVAYHALSTSLASNPPAAVVGKLLRAYKTVDAAVKEFYKRG